MTYYNREKYIAIGNLCQQIRGVSYSQNEASEIPHSNYFPILRATNIQDGQLHFEKLIYVPKDRISEQQFVKENDIVIAASSGSIDIVGKAAQAKKSFSGGFGAFCKVLRPLTNTIEPNYFSYFFQTTGYRKTVSKLAEGANINNLRNEHFDELLIPLPPLEEQKRIAEILDAADRLRRLRREARKLTDTFLQSVFIEMFGEPASNPKGWPIVQIEDVVSLAQYGTSEKSNTEGKGYPVLGMGNITYDGRLQLSNLSHVDLPSSELEKLKLTSGDIIFNRTNSTELVGKCTYWNQSIDAVLASYLVKLKLTEELSSVFFTTLLNTSYFKKLFQERCKKAVGQSNISPTLLKEFKVYLPPLNKQQDFERLAQKANVIRQREAEAERQAELNFQSLLNQAFNGELSEKRGQVV